MQTTMFILLYTIAFVQLSSCSVTDGKNNPGCCSGTCSGPYTPNPSTKTSTCSLHCEDKGGFFCQKESTFCANNYFEWAGPCNATAGDQACPTGFCCVHDNYYADKQYVCLKCKDESAVPGCVYSKQTVSPSIKTEPVTSASSQASSDVGSTASSTAKPRSERPSSTPSATAKPRSERPSSTPSATASSTAEPSSTLSTAASTASSTAEPSITPSAAAASTASSTAEPSSTPSAAASTASSAAEPSITPSAAASTAAKPRSEQPGSGQFDGAPTRPGGGRPGNEQPGSGRFDAAPTEPGAGQAGDTVEGDGNDSSDDDDSVDDQGPESSGYVTRVATTTPSVSSNNNANYQSPCGKCALRYIFSSFCVEGLTLQQLPKRAGKKFAQNLKKYIKNELGKRQERGLKEIKVTSFTNFNRKNLIVEFVSTVDPKLHSQLNNAIRLVLLKLNVNKAFE